VDNKKEALEAQHGPLLIRVSTLRAITKADVYPELTRNRKKTREQQAISRPVATGQTP
jgi:hypothetical protein